MKQVSGVWRLGTVAAVAVAGGAVVFAFAQEPDATQGSPGPVVTRGSISLAGYDSCDTALRNLRDSARPYVGPYGFGGDMAFAEDSGGATVEPMPAQPEARSSEGSASGAPKEAAPEHSGTNVHEAGVDEPDVVKTDGKRIVSVVDGTVRVVDVATRKLTGSALLPQGNATNLLLDGDRALVVVGGATDVERPASRPMPDSPSSSSAPSVGGSGLVLIDLTDGVKVLGSLAVSGSYVDARQTGHVARVVLRSSPTLKFTVPYSGASATASREANLRVLDESSIDDWLPQYQLTVGAKTTTGNLVGCDAISHPADFSGTSMLSVLTFDLTGELGTGDAVSIAADGDTVYGSGPNLYVADDHRLRPARFGGPRYAPQSPDTVLYQFDTSGPGRPSYIASGTVQGSLLNQYSLAEFDGTLRVATTTGSDNAVSVLRRNGDQLVQLGRLDGLGEGERLQAARFIGDRGYVVTFRQTDPLYVIDLSDPRNPRKAGELQLTGFSSYLHDAGDGRLIGIGTEATGSGQRTGMQVSVFDVRDPDKPTRVAHQALPDGWSQAEQDPHAFLYWPKTGTLVVPVFDGRTNAASAKVFTLTGDKLSETTTLRHPTATTMLERSAVIGSDLWTVSDDGMLVNTLSGLRQQAWIPFG